MAQDLVDLSIAAALRKRGKEPTPDMIARVRARMGVPSMGAPAEVAPKPTSDLDIAQGTFGQGMESRFNVLDRASRSIASFFSGVPSEQITPGVGGYGGMFSDIAGYFRGVATAPENQPTPEQEGKFRTNFMQAAGSMAASAPDALVGGAFAGPVGAFLGAAGSGGAIEYVSAYDEVLRTTGDPEKASGAAVWAMLGGLTEGVDALIPVAGRLGRVFAKVDKATGGAMLKDIMSFGVKDAAKSFAKGAATNFTQETLQGAYSEGVIRYFQDNPMDAKEVLSALREGAWREGLPSAILGGPMGVLEGKLAQLDAVRAQGQAKVQAEAQTEAQQAAEAWTAPVEAQPEPQPIEEVGGPQPIEVVGAAPGTPWQQAAQGQAGIPAAQTPTVPAEAPLEAPAVETTSPEPAGSPQTPPLASEVTPAPEAILEAPAQSGEAQTQEAAPEAVVEPPAAPTEVAEPESPIPLPSEAAQVPQSETQTAPRAPEVDPADTVGIANRKMEETSAKYGLEPAEDTDPETFVGWFDEAKKIYDNEPQKAAALVTELEDSPRAPTAVEDLVLGLEVRARVNALDEAIKRYNADATEENRKAWEIAAERYESIKDTVKAVGTASGRSLVARKALIGAEFTYEGMLGRRMAAEGGESALLREEGGAEKVNAIREEVKRQYDEIKEIEKQQAVESAKAESEARVKALTEQVEALRSKVREQGSATPKKAPSKAPSRQREIQRSKARIDELVKELAVIGRRANVGAPLDPKALKIVFDIAVEAVRVGAMTFQEWTSTIKAHIDAADAELQKVWNDAGKSVRAERADTLKSKIESGKGPTSIRGTLIEVAESIIRDNMEIKSEALADEVYAAVKDAVPGWSRDQVAQVLSGYGNYKKLTDDLVKRRRQQLLSEVQTDMKLLDVAKGERPKKSGVERMPPSDSQRRKTQQLHEEMKRAGINPAGEYDLKSALDAAKTRERNLISDLDYAIEQRERIVKERKLLVPDAELAALKARRAESQKTYDEMFAMERQAEQRAREIAYVEEQIAAGGKTKPNTPVQGPPSDPKIAGLDKRLMDLKAKLAEIRKNDPEKLSKAARIKAEREAASFEKKIAVLESVIANRGEPAPKAGPVQGPPADPKRAEYQRQIMFLKERVAAIRKEERTKASQSEEAQRKRLISSLERQIAKLEGKDAKAKEAKPQGPTADPKVAELQRTLLERRAELQRLKAADETRTQKALEQSLQRSILRMEQMIREDGKRPKAAKERPTSPLIRARESELKALKAELEALPSTQKSKEERLIAASIARKEAAIERLERNTIMQDLTGEHIEMKKRERRAPSKDEVRWAAKQEEALNRNLKSSADIAWKKAGKGKKALVALSETPAILRSLRTAFDFSAVLVQAGAPTLGHPLKALRTWIPNMIRAAKSEEFYQQLDAGIRLHPLFGQARRDGLEIAEIDGKMSKREEMFAANILQKLPGIAGAGVRGSSRAYLAYINAVRMDSYASIYRGKPGLVTEAEGKEIAKFVNVFTGRGDLATLDEAFDKAKRITNLGQQRKSRFFSRIADGSAWVLWAPRLYLSRLQMLMSPLYYAKSSEGKTAFIRKTVAKEMARWLAAEASVYMLVHLYKEMSDDDEIEVETDPRSSDFGKYRVGETRIDPWGGLAQFAVLLSRMATGETKTLSGEVVPIRGSEARYGNTGYDVATRFARGKFNPFASLVTDYLLAGQNVIGESRELPKSVGDTPRFAGEVLGNYFAPMLPLAIYQNLRDQGFSKGAAFSILSAFGTSIQNYDR